MPLSESARTQPQEAGASFGRLAHVLHTILVKIHFLLLDRCSAPFHARHMVWVTYSPDSYAHAWRRVSKDCQPLVFGVFGGVLTFLSHDLFHCLGDRFSGGLHSHCKFSRRGHRVPCAIPPSGQWLGLGLR